MEGNAFERGSTFPCEVRLSQILESVVSIQAIEPPTPERITKFLGIPFFDGDNCRKSLIVHETGIIMRDSSSRLGQACVTGNRPMKLATRFHLGNLLGKMRLALRRSICAGCLFEHGG